ncbi:Multicopper oxidase with three cupredoxin domains (includes cell division protein FtsP and spore coat protein CotA) [Micromonospora pattaloongensis]|uniref:Copper-containing nitrite reductase n=1 Tax=Micromonospora pattaloongensis TaxID=405436 RepID=A0A1H3H2V6_9ACTN|nr:multicopper oxidase family protein [Micromonospora pattaloongensis]SDY09852.1 Multicopper oxidase with three cupredoxin domains (includes cell division protein FtsP and spore coat protein CotA) [Micromonospora pattaloongensis]
MFLWVHYTDMVTAMLAAPAAVVAVWAALRLPASPGSGPSRMWRLLFGLLLGGAALRVVAALLLLPNGWDFAGPRLVFVAPALAVVAAVHVVWVRRALGSPGGERRAATWPGDYWAVMVAAGVMLVASAAQLAGMGSAALAGVGVLGIAAMGSVSRPTRWSRRLAGRWWRSAAEGVLGVVVAAAVLAAMSTASRLPASSSMTGGPADIGGGSMTGHSHHDGVSVVRLTGTDTAGVPTRRFTLTAQPATVQLDSGQRVEAWTFNGVAPGPQLLVRQGDLVEVTLVNRLPGVGVTLHWHGVDVPNAMDGVAGVTQDAVAPGGSFVYRFRATQVGTYWYHSHEMSSLQVRRGLFGAFVVLPVDTPEQGDAVDETVLRHTWLDEDGVATLGVTAGEQRRQVPAGRQVRLRLVNTDGNPAAFTLTGAAVRVVAIDGADVHEPNVLSGVRILVGGGARYDLAFTMPDQPVVLHADGPTIVYSPDGNAGPGRVSAAPALLDPARYGTPAATPFGADSHFDRRFTLRVDERLGFYDGRPAVRYTLNNESFPDVPMLMVAPGDLVDVTYVNRSGQHHPMHLHGHHMLVLNRNGRPTSGSPWWVDTLDVGPGETYRVAFRADNPGIWMDHCHNLEHAANGMILHLGYTGITTPFQTGRGTANHPE